MACSIVTPSGPVTGGEGAGVCAGVCAGVGRPRRRRRRVRGAGRTARPCRGASHDDERRQEHPTQATSHGRKAGMTRSAKSRSVSGAARSWVKNTNSVMPRAACSRIRATTVVGSADVAALVEPPARSRVAALGPRQRLGQCVVGLDEREHRFERDAQRRGIAPDPLAFGADDVELRPTAHPARTSGSSRRRRSARPAAACGARRRRRRGSAGAVAAPAVARSGGRRRGSGAPRTTSACP